MALGCKGDCRVEGFCKQGLVSCVLSSAHEAFRRVRAFRRFGLGVGGLECGAFCPVCSRCMQKAYSDMISCSLMELPYHITSELCTHLGPNEQLGDHRSVG